MLQALISLSESPLGQKAAQPFVETKNKNLLALAMASGRTAEQ